MRHEHPGHDATRHDPSAELRTAGLAVTAQRRMVLGVLGGQQESASAIEIHAQLRRRLPQRTKP
jgi:Fe2+ or Zn2+ uptake regulation protein